MRYRLKTLMLIIAGLAAPIYAATEGWKLGGLCGVALVVLAWSLLVGVPLGFVIWLPERTAAGSREELIGSFVTLAILGTIVALTCSLLIHGYYSAMNLHR